MSVVTKNKVVSITYRILDENQEVREQSDIPVDYIHGINNPMFEKVERALEGKKLGDDIKVVLSPAEGFGEHDPKLTFTDDIENVPPEYRRVGAKPQFESADGNSVEMLVTEVKEGKVTVDSNHPFAGKTMTFHVIVVNIRDASGQEISQGQPISASAH